MNTKKWTTVRKLFSLTQREEDAIAVLTKLHSTTASEVVRQALREKLERDTQKL